MPARRDAVVSCHVESPLDDRSWGAFSRFQRAAPGGFRIAALLRAPHDGEDEARWVERAREASAHGPLGHHTHFARPDHARPVTLDDVERMPREIEWLRARDVRPTLFCGGGWYVDERVARAAAAAGYVDCTGVAFRHPYFHAQERTMLEVAEPTSLVLERGGRLLELPTTHSIGMLVRELAHGFRVPLVHVYFHDYDLIPPRRRLLIASALRGLAVRCRRSDLDEAARAYAARAPARPFAEAQAGTSLAP